MKLKKIRTQHFEALRHGARHRPDRFEQNEHSLFSVARLNTVDTNIMTIEDPVEFQLAGINQVQMKEQIGLNFAAALRASSGKTPTSFWSVRSATLKRPKS